ncbi:hypothetical protein CCR75_009591 [Bremia lactucae]|uniref:Chromo domain-containing protein n=1 Tax=Bremia lactucae TaxID=4779 RepID=A0A976NZH5_BRELC|nr:hypothetical protein CCR75_009591 [Bremia lactucae]
MASALLSTAYTPSTDTGAVDDHDRQFVTTWLRLMERCKDVTEISEALQRVLSQPEDESVKLQDVRHQINLLCATDKTIADLVARINEYFFWDIVPVLERARPSRQATSVDAHDCLDRYLECGAEDTPIPQDFVDHMSGWGDAAEYSDVELPTDMDDAIPADVAHDRLIANSLKWTASMAQAHSSPCRQPQQKSFIAQELPLKSRSPLTLRSKALKNRIKTPKQNERKSDSSLLSPCKSSIEGLPKKERVESRNKATANVLGMRTLGKTTEYYVRVAGSEAPRWITRRKATSQAKEWIDLYKLSARDRSLSHSKQTRPPQELTKPSRKKASEHINVQRKAGKRRTEDQGAAFYSVDHIVSHRVFHQSRQYLVRWEHYDESGDTWEQADKLRADVPEIVDAYEEQLRCRQARTEALKSDRSELDRNGGATSRATHQNCECFSTTDSLDSFFNKQSTASNQAESKSSRKKRKRDSRKEDNERSIPGMENCREDDKLESETHESRSLRT